MEVYNLPSFMITNFFLMRAKKIKQALKKKNARVSMEDGIHGSGWPMV
jgi:hypothetical protein